MERLEIIDCISQYVGVGSLSLPAPARLESWAASVAARWRPALNTRRHLARAAVGPGNTVTPTLNKERNHIRDLLKEFATNKTELVQKQIPQYLNQK